MQQKELSIPDTDIAEWARKIGSEDADDLAVLQFLMQSSATAQLVKLRKLEESKIPIGVYSLPLTVPDSLLTYIVSILDLFQPDTERPRSPLP